ncbi:hypothetical protein [Xylophilus sp.]|uniref:hypothetical protein n=1 Tax=Xylophilus sp. TaxID=2653893 RepID=UPI002D7E2F61|nr:hypothetical protein [Xylophilus sp.]
MPDDLQPVRQYRSENYDASVRGPVELFGRKHQVVASATRQSLDTGTAAAPAATRSTATRPAIPG